MLASQLAEADQGLLDAGRTLALQDCQQAGRPGAEGLPQRFQGYGFARRRQDADDLRAAAFGRLGQALAEEAADGDDGGLARLQGVQQGRLEDGLLGAGNEEGILVLRAPELTQAGDGLVQHGEEARVVGAFEDADEPLTRARRGVAEVRPEERALRRVEAAVGQGRGVAPHCSSGIRNCPASMTCKSSSQMLLLRQGKSMWAFETFWPWKMAVLAPKAICMLP